MLNKLKISDQKKVYWSGLKIDNIKPPQSPLPPLSGGLPSETIQLKKSETVYEPEISNQTSIKQRSLLKLASRRWAKSSSLSVLSFLVLSLGLLMATAPQSSFAFSSSELDSLESSGEKSVSKSPWRTEIGFSLHRNTELNILYDEQLEYVSKEYKENKDNPALDPNHKDSIYDNWAYAWRLKLNYSLKSLEHPFLKKTELFLIASFDEPFDGYHPNFNRWVNLHYGFQDIVVGITAPFYRTENFFSDISLILIPLPMLSLIHKNLQVSRFSMNATFLGSTGVSASLLYFLQKQNRWSLAVSSIHSATYRDFQEDITPKGHNIDIAAMNIASLLFRQSYIAYLPYSSSLFAGYDFARSRSFLQENSGENSRNQERDRVMKDMVTIGLSLSWKLESQMYFNFSVKWNDIWHKSNNKGSMPLANKDFKWFSRDRTIFSLGGSYTF